MAEPFPPVAAPLEPPPADQVTGEGEGEGEPPRGPVTEFEVTDQFRDILEQNRERGGSDDEVFDLLIADGTVTGDQAEAIKRVMSEETLGDATPAGEPEPPVSEPFVEIQPAPVRVLLERYTDPKKRQRAFDMLVAADGEGVDWDDSDDVRRVLSDVVREVEAPGLASRFRHAPALVATTAGLAVGAFQELVNVVGQTKMREPTPGVPDSGPGVTESFMVRQRQFLGMGPVNEFFDVGEGEELQMTGTDPEVADLFRQIRTQTPAMAAATEADLAERMARYDENGTFFSVGTLATAVDLIKSDGIDNVSGIIDILSFISTFSMKDEAFRLSFADHMAAQFGHGREFGQVMVGGFIGGSSAMIDNLPQMLATRPISTALILSPALKALRRAGHLPGRFNAFVDAADQVASAVVQDTVSTSKVVPFVAKRAFQDVVTKQRTGLLQSLKESSDAFGESVKGGGTPGEPLALLTPREWAAVHRWTVDSLKQSNLAEQAIVDRVIREPKKVRTEIEALADEAARATEQQRMTKGDVLSDVPEPVPRDAEFFSEVRGTMDAASPAEAFRTVRDDVLPGALVDEPVLDLVNESVDRMKHQVEGQKARLRGEVPVVVPEKVAPAPAAATVEQVVDNIKQSGIDISTIRVADDLLELSKIVVDEDARGQGLGSTAMAELLAATDAAGIDVALTPDPAFGGSVKRLKQFYGRMGFKPNKAARKDFRTRSTMIRPAEPTPAPPKPKVKTRKDPTPAEALRLRQEIAELEMLIQQGEGIMAGVDPAVFGPEGHLLEPTLMIQFDAEPGKIFKTTAETAELILAAEQDPAVRASLRPILTITAEELARLEEVAPYDANALRAYQGAVVDPKPLSPMLSPEELAKGRDIRVKPRSQAATLTSDLASETIGRITDEILANYDPIDLQVRVKREGMRALRDVKLTSLGDIIPEGTAAAVLGDVFRDEASVLLRSEVFRKKVARRISAKTKSGPLAKPGITVRGAEAALKGQAEDTLFSNSLDLTIDATMKNGEVVRVGFLDEAFAAWGDLPPKDQARFRAEALRRVGALIAAGIETKRVEAALVAEVARGRLAGPGQVGTYVDRLVDMVLLDGDAQPQILTGHSPRGIAQQIEGDMPRQVERLVEQGYDPGAAAKALEELALEIDFGYTERTDILSDIRVALKKDDLPPELVSDVTAVARGFNSSVGSHMRSIAAVTETDAVTARVMRALKGNVTVMNLPTHKNNFGANFALATLRRGTTPFGMSASLLKTGKLWRGFKKGTLEDPNLIADFQALERQGVLNTSLLDGELGVLENVATPKDVLQGLQNAMNKTAGKAYQFGDNIFKLDDALHNMRIGREQMAALDVGEWMRLDGQSGKSTWLIRDVDGWKSVETQPKASHKSNRVLMDKDRPAQEFFHLIDEVSLDGLLADAAVVPGQEIFFDYSKVPLYLEFLRANQGLGLVSPFLTWSWKALDIPGVKRGIVGHMLFGDHQIAPVTNSAAMNKMHLAAGVEMSLRRATAMGSMRANLMTQDKDHLQKLFRRNPGDVGVVMINEATHPSYTAFSSQSQLNAMQPSLTALSLGLEAFIQVADLIDEDWSDDNLWDTQESAGELLNVAKVAKERKLSIPMAKDVVRRRRLVLASKRGEFGGADTALGLAGVNGSIMIDFVHDLTQKGDVNPQSKFRDYGALLIGGTPKRMVEGMATLLDPESDVSTYQFAVRADPVETERVAAWFARALTGIGWRERHTAKQRDQWMERMRMTMMDSVNDDITRRAGILEKKMRGAAPEDKRALGNQRDGLINMGNRMTRAINSEMRKIAAPYKQITDRVMPKKPRKFRPDPGTEQRATP